MAEETTTNAPFHAMDDHVQEGEVVIDQEPILDDFFDTSESVNPNNSSNNNRYNLSSERFIFDGEEEDVCIISSLANPYSGISSTNEPLLPGYHIAGGLQHQFSSGYEDDDVWSADHPLAIPFARLQQQQNQPQYNRHELSGLNYLNLLIFAIYLTVSILFQSDIVEWLPSPWTVTTIPEYETLLTPVQWAGDYLWIPVLGLEGLFALVQLLPQARARPEVVEGVAYYWFYIAIGQCLATILFCLKWIIPAWVALAMTAICLLVLHLKLKQQHTTTSIVTKWKFWIFRFPFDLHLGWLLPLLAARASMIFRHYGKHDVGLQLGADIVAMALLLPCAGAYLVRSNRGPQDWVVPLVILWAYIGIACRLLHTPQVLVELYTMSVVVAVRGAAWCFAGTVSLFVVPRIFIWVARECLTIRVVQLTDDDEGDEEVEDLLLNDPTEPAVVGMTQF